MDMRPTRSSFLNAALVMTLALTAGCHTTMIEAMREVGPVAWPDGAQRVQVDREASAVLITSDGTDIRDDEELLAGLRGQIARGLELASSPSGVPTPIRFQAQVHGSVDQMLIWPCFVAFTLYGCPFAEVEATATVTFDINGTLYHGAGVGSAYMNVLYYNRGTLAPFDVATLRAIAAATKAALSSTPYAALSEGVERQLLPPQELANAVSQ